jgi:hypothetical protein
LNAVEESYAMKTIRIDKTVDADGEILLTGLPFKSGQHVEIMILNHDITKKSRSNYTVGQLRNSGLLGLWENRDDLSDSSQFARSLRDQVQRRSV